MKLKGTNCVKKKKGDIQESSTLQKGAFPNVFYSFKYARDKSGVLDKEYQIDEGYIFIYRDDSTVSFLGFNGFGDANYRYYISRPKSNFLERRG